MNIHFGEGCNPQSDRVMGLFVELSDLERKCIEATVAEPGAHNVEEAAIACSGRNADGSCGLRGSFPCLKAIIEDCVE